MLFSRRKVAPPEFVVDPKLVKAAEGKTDLVAFYVVWVVGERGVMLGATKSPRNISSYSAQYNKKKTECRLFWAKNKGVATWILSYLRDRYAKQFLHGTWYDVESKTAIADTLDFARRMKFWLCTTEDRHLLLEDAARQAASMALSALPVDEEHEIARGPSNLLSVG